MGKKPAENEQLPEVTPEEAQELREQLAAKSAEVDALSGDLAAATELLETADTHLQYWNKSAPGDV